MNDQLKQLIELQKIDAAILFIQRTLDDMPKKIKEVESPLREAESHLKGVQEMLDALEKKYDKQFKVVFDAIRQLMTPPSPKRKGIGFLQDRS